MKVCRCPQYSVDRGGGSVVISERDTEWDLNKAGGWQLMKNERKIEKKQKIISKAKESEEMKPRMIIES